MEKTTNEELARMINTGFEDLKKDVGELKSDVGELKFDVNELKSDVSSLKKDMNVVKTELSHVNARLSTIEHDVAQIGKEMISRNEFEDLMGRVKYLELKLGIESGK